ncbi:MAG: pantetheine-phosphate adenylyltransferase [Candidatus Altiarchaeota archaeon]
MFKKAVVGGTFDRFHMGHKEILKKAFNIADSVVIGMTSDEFANRFRSFETLSYEKREKIVEGYVKTMGKGYNIVEIHDSYGIATIDPDIDCIVVSEETLLRAEEINAIRFKKGIPKLNILMIPIMLAQDGKPISSERIIRREIDPEGRKI